MLLGLFFCVIILELRQGTGQNVNVEMDIFSGKRNPTIQLPLEYVRRLVPNFGLVCDDTYTEFSALGYRGFTVYGPLTTLMVIPKGSNRRAEMRLLRLYDIPSDVRQYVRQEIIRSSRLRRRRHRVTAPRRCRRITEWAFQSPASNINDLVGQGQVSF